MAVLAIVYDFGFNQSPDLQQVLYAWYMLAMGVAIVSIMFRYATLRHKRKTSARLADALLVVLFVNTVIAQIPGITWLDESLPALDFIEHHSWSYLMVFLAFLRELSEQNTGISRKYLNPAQLFVISFVLIVAVGTTLLLLPNATHGGISSIDALFTATSAVCVTGLTVVDTGTHFTRFGQWIILVLIQVGGIGIMTFTSYFSHFFRGSSSFESHLMLGDMSNEQKMSEVFGTLKRIIVATFIVELAGALFIFFCLDSLVLKTLDERFFFAAFHSIASFCNAGFSTLSQNLYDIDYRYNYPLQVNVVFLIILGGLGFPILFNFLSYVKHFLKSKWLMLTHQPEVTYVRNRISVNSKIVLITTAILIVAGTVVFWIFEYNNTLVEHQPAGKFVTALFGAVTPRTAGFNTVDMTKLQFPTIMFTFLLMWIGASPGSTGGGIKTSTLAIATLNFFSLARGRDRIEVYRREVSDTSVRRAFAIISLSLIALGAGIFSISMLDSDKKLIEIAFECFSAYSTTGLSLGVTPAFTAGSKLVLIALMFSGRVGMLTLLVAVLKKVKHANYSYPTEDILIN